MIHRHKHEMTLKFPSIKNDNMLSGELHAADAADVLGMSVPLYVCMRVIHAQTDTLIFHQEWRGCASGLL